MKKRFSLGFWSLILILSLSVAFSGFGFAADSTKAAAKPAAGGEYKVNLNQIAFIVKYDKDGNGKVDNKEFTGEHFPNMDKNGDGFIEPHEAPEGQTAY